jgi:hypothetical protein
VKRGQKSVFDIKMPSWGRRPSVLALLFTNRGRGIDWRRFYLNRSQSWKVDFLTPPLPKSTGVVFQHFFLSILWSGTNILSILSETKKSLTLHPPALGMGDSYRDCVLKAKNWCTVKNIKEIWPKLSKTLFCKWT